MSQIKAKVIQDSISQGIRLVTLEIEYPRFIHSEFMTHRMFSRNCASSRAIPVQTMLDNIAVDPAMPIHWGKNRPGMQAREELEGDELIAAKNLWVRASVQAVNYASAFEGSGVHKQVANRITEPFQIMKTVVSATEWLNFFELRNHTDAQPEIRELAVCMAIAINNSNSMELQVGEWHVPYVDRKRDTLGYLYYIDSKGEAMHPEDAKRISASCCAQVSYRKSDDSLEKALAIYDKLVGMNPKHSSPFEHQATPVDHSTYEVWVPGVTHVSEHDVWSGNFRGWIQHRHLI